MGKFFSAESGFGRFLARCFDLILINILTLVCSLPLITFGAAQTAMYYTILKLRRDESISITCEFFRSFKQNIKQGVVLSLVYILFFGIIVFDLALGNRSENAAFRLILYAAPVIGLIGAVSYVWAFPLLSRYRNTVKGTVKCAFAISIAYPIKTLIMVVLNALPIVLLFLTGRALPALTILGLSLPGYIICGMYDDIFTLLETPEE